MMRPTVTILRRGRAALLARHPLALAHRTPIRRSLTSVSVTHRQLCRTCHCHIPSSRAIHTYRPTQQSKQATPHASDVVAPAAPSSSSSSSSTPANASQPASGSAAAASTRAVTVDELLTALQTGTLQPIIPTQAVDATARAANASASNNDSSSSSLSSAFTPPPSARPPLIRVRGWLRSIRGSKTTSFLTLNDGSSLYNLQIVVDAPVAAACMERASAEGMKDATFSNGCSVEITGELLYSYKVTQQYLRAQSEADSSKPPLSPLSSLPSLLHSTAQTPQPQLPLVEVLARDIRLVGVCDPSVYPLGKHSIPLDHLRELVHLRTRTATMGAVTRIRSEAQHLVHQFFKQEGFFNVHTPILTPLDCEGAGEVFSVTSSLEKPDQPFFGRPTYLTVSGQLYAEMVACSLGRVYTFGPTFRAEHSQTNKHLNEFWMIEPEMAHADLDSCLDISERFVKYMVRHLLTNCETDLLYLESRYHPSLISDLHSMLDQPFVRLTYSDAIDLLVDAAKSRDKKTRAKFQFLPKWEEGLQSEHEKWLADVKFKRPVFITRYPRSIKPFYMKADTSSLSVAGRETVRCFDLIVPGVGELIGGSEREEKYDQLLANMQHHKLDTKQYGWYLDLRAFGSVPHSSVHHA